MKSFAAQDKYARYTIEFKDDIIIARVTGAIGETLTLSFCRDMKHMIESLPAGTLWGYLGDMSDCDGYTGQAERHMIDNSNLAKVSGCMVDAYVFGSPVARSQLYMVRNEARLPGESSERTFNSVEEATQFLHDSLISIKEITAKQ